MKEHEKYKTQELTSDQSPMLSNSLLIHLKQGGGGRKENYLGEKKNQYYQIYCKERNHIYLL